MAFALRRAGLVVIFSLLFSPLTIQAQADPQVSEGDQSVRLYVDCKAYRSGCADMDFLRTEIPFVNWVRDMRDADVYVLVTELGTGAGGASTELAFSGSEGYEGMVDTLTYVSAFDASTDDRRRGFVQYLKIGLMRFVGQTLVAEEIDIRFMHRDLKEGVVGPSRSVTSPEDDPWDFWVFRVRGSGGLNAYTNYKSRRFSGSFSASRTTEDWKASLSLSTSYSDTRYDYPELDYYRLSIRRSHSVNGSLVKAKGPNWSLGLRGSARNASFYNFDFAGSIAPIVEYSVFPYSEATRKSLTFQYALEAVYHNYQEETIFFKDKESFLTQSLAASLSLNRPWGTAWAAMEGAHHIDDVDLHHVTFFTGVQFRLSRGLSLSVHGDVSRVRDLVSVAAGAADSVEEVLLRRRQFQTDYRFSTNISLSYSFGSIFNNIVNPRLGGGGIGIPMILF